MTATHLTENTMPDNALIEELLDDLDLEADGSDDAFSELDEAIDENLAPETQAIVEKEAEAALDMDLAKLEAYEEATGDSSLEMEAPSPTRTRPRAAATRPKGRELAELPVELFVLTAEGAADLEANRAAVIAGRPTVKKVAEKFDNLFQCLAVGKAPSVYVMKAFKMLDEQKAVTAADIIREFEKSGYSKGTASSQAGQIMALFATLKIADRHSGALSLVESSPVAALLRALS